MSTPAVHDSFIIERTLKHAPARVFNAFADPAAKQKWFANGPGLKVLIRELDFRVGGLERTKGLWAEKGVTSDFENYYHDIVPNERIVYSYRMRLNDKIISVSMATIEFTPAGAGTKLKITEQAAYLDGFEDGGGREEGTNKLIDQLVASLDD